jgi:hypothetical protein
LAKRRTPAPVSARTRPAPSTHRGLTIIAAAALAVITLAVFAQLSRAEFLTFDDDQFVTANAHVRSGLSARSVKWALTSAEEGFYPLTWLSYMTDVQLFGLDAGRHHLMNVALHIASSVVLLLILLACWRAARSSESSPGEPSRDIVAGVALAAFGAALFAIHPMHVESVAWVAERKDTLSTLFGFLAVLVYLKHPRHWLVAVFLAASLLAKQMLVTLPVVLLALDFWPLRRVSAQCTVHSAQESRGGLFHCARCSFDLVREKLLLFAIVAAGVAIAVIGQRHLAAIQPLDVQPTGQRIANALVAYAVYLGKLFVPIRLAVFYPLVTRSAAAAVASAFLLAAITYVAWRFRERAPYLATGWIWFLVTLLPVIGLVQIGEQAMADRYSYVPSVGIFIAIAWAAYDFLPRKLAAAAGVLMIGIFAVAAHRQTTYWHDTRSLFTQAVEVTGPNATADFALGNSFIASDPDTALYFLRRTLAECEAKRQRNPHASTHLAVETHIAIGNALLAKAMVTDRAEAPKYVGEAEQNYRTALAMDANDPVRRGPYNLAVAENTRRKVLGRGDDAESMIAGGIRLLDAGRVDDAVAQLRHATVSAAGLPEPHVYLAIALSRGGRKAEAAQELRTAEAINASMANVCLTNALRLPFSDDNLQNEIARLTKP